ncbi:serine/threonine-protein kinase [Tahibacter harae]|uniref:Tetratricopeptide repeat protein n=1 Tax=Tahibacter harae TaxID=2963937 RepID=A0ABT1QW16_9GAMM|nr:serine/threonine-protein kinase [Tahibacter harae]MCQ4166477.1 tetratricopeptide repeat protein [Tahibacter harae]
MNNARWLRLQQLFDALVELAPEDRAAWLAQQPDEDALKQEALALVLADERDSAAVTRQFGSAVAELAPAPASGLMLGPYRLLCEIGSGGMGTVFLAERADAEFDRQVAIKLIRGIPTRDAAERLRRERQILAKLEHPHIARLLDGGTSPDGQPYLVMEYVAGEPITRWCREQRTPLAARLELFRKVCLAVQYAHQRLVIHRDLKPANVLVRRDGEPALLDFGIAKLLDPNSSGRQEATGAHWFTPTYASPEQRRGEAVNTATDVYALGLLLYEVLTEQVPAPGSDGHFHVGRPLRGDGTRLPAELGLIVGRATHQDPVRRYASPEALSEDLRRYLRGRPILAAPDSWSYRTGKFLNRHPLSVFAACLALVAIALFTVRLAAERDRALRAEKDAQRESATSRHVVDYLVRLFDAAAPENAGNTSLSPKELIDRGQHDIDTRLANEPEQRARLLAAFGRIYTELGDPDSAALVYRKAAEAEQLLGNTRQEAIYLNQLGYVLNLAERPEEAEPVLHQALAKLQALDPPEPRELIDLYATLSLAESRRGDLRTGLAHAQQTRELLRQYNISDYLLVTRSLTSLAEAHMRNNQLAEAEQAAQQAIDLLRRHLPADSAEVVSATGFMTDIYERQERHADRERLLREMLQTRLRNLAPGSAWAITARNNLAQAIYLQGRMLEALPLFRENLEHLRASGQQDSPSYSITLNNLASLSEQAEDFDSAIPLFREAYENELPKPGKPPSPRLAMFRQNYGRSLLLAGKLDQAWPLLSVEIEESMEGNTERARRLLHLAEWMRRSNQLTEAARYANQAGAAFAQFLPPGHPRHAAVARARGLILRDQGRLAEAAEQLRQALEVLRKANGPQSNTTLECQVQLAQVLASAGARTEALALLQPIQGALEQHFVKNAPLLRQQARLLAQLQSS